jgi:peptidoglycan/LPS O-acetylase OafA/YrhL
MPLPAISLPLVWLGRQSLSWYLLHQPVMIGLLMLVGYIKAMG